MTRQSTSGPGIAYFATAIMALSLPAASAQAGNLANLTIVAVPGAQAATTTPYAINNSGEIAGQYLDPAVGYRVFALNGGNYSTVDPGPAVAQNGSYFASLNNSGQILGFANTITPPNYGFYYLADHQGAITAFPPPTAVLPANVSGYSAFNDNGAIAGQAGNAAFISKGGVATTINPPTSTSTFINAINDTGGIVGQFNPAVAPSPYANQSAFVYEKGVYTTLSAPGARFTEATGINDNGVVVGYFDSAPVIGPNGVQVTPITGFTYDDGVYREYNVPGQLQTELFGINNAGKVVGYYIGGSGGSNGFTALAAVPEPEAWILMLVGFGGLGVALRSRRRALQVQSPL